MGTSKAYTTPSGGPWQEAKTRITRYLRDAGEREYPRELVGSIVRANGGIGTGKPATQDAASGGTSGVGRVVSAVGAFADTVSERGLGEALGLLALHQLDGLPALQVTAAIAEHIARTNDGLQSELLRTALQEAILEAAQLSSDTEFDDLEAGLQQFLEERGAIGLVELFLAYYSYEAVWMLIEQHVNERILDETAYAALSAAIEGVCQTEVSRVLREFTHNGRLHNVDWFGRDGQQIADEIVAAVVERLS